MRIYQRNKRWWVERSYNPKRYRRSAGRTKREALSKLGKIAQRIKEEEENGTPATAPRSFSEYAKEYLIYSKAEKAESSYKREHCKMGFLCKVFGNKKLGDIRTVDIERYKQSRIPKAAPATVNRELALIKHVFTKPDGRPYGNWRNAFDKAVKRAGIEDFRFHDLRHTFASYMVMYGKVDIRTLQVLMGHKTIL